MSEGNQAAVAAGYQVRVTSRTYGGTALWVRVLRGDPSRVYVEFHHSSAGTLTVGPAGIQDTPPNQFELNTPGPWMWRDCPAIVTGDWYALDQVAGTLYMLEELKVPGG